MIQDEEGPGFTSMEDFTLYNEYVPLNNDDDDEDVTITPQHKEELKAAFGHKTIGFFGGLSLLVGNMTGPGMVGICLQFQQGGWLLTIAGFILVLVCSSLAALFMAEAMATIPGNPRFQLRVEFSMLCRFYFGKWGYLVAQIFINVALQATNIASIIVCAQIMDDMLISIFKKTCGLVAYPKVEWICEHTAVDSSSPFPDHYYMFFTLGYLIVMVLIIPLGLLNLDDNIIVQIGAVILMFCITSSWVIMFFVNGLNPSYMPTFGTPRGIAQIMGNVMFNYSYITTVPSWINESKPSVNIKKSIWMSSSFSTFIFIAIGVFGALSFPAMTNDSNILSVINASHMANTFTRILVYIFPFVVLASSIPVYSIIVRYNLMQNNLLPKIIANAIAVVLPWAIALPFMTGDGLNQISEWASLFFSSIANFIIPLLLYIRSLYFRKSKKAMSADQRKILKTLVLETVDWEKNQEDLKFEEHHTMFKVFEKLKREKSNIVDIVCLSILGLLIPFVIITNFVFPS